MPYPDNGAYMVAAYVVAAVLVLGYTVSLWVRLRRESGRGSMTDDVNM